MTMRKKLIILICCLSVVLCTLVTGTLAWLISESGPITNTFTPSNVKVELTETGTTTKDGVISKDFKMIPGKTYAKDPKVTVTTNINCYVFVKVEKSANFDTYMTCSVDTSKWTLVSGCTDVYYCVIETDTDTAKDIPVLTDNQVTIRSDLTMVQMNAFYGDNALANPTLKFTAYAIQQEGFATPAAAWAEASK